MIFRFKQFINKIIKDWKNDIILCRYDDDARAFGYEDGALLIGGDSDVWYFNLSKQGDRRNNYNI